MASNLSRAAFFQALPVRSRIMLMAFVFCIFAPAAILLISPFKYDRSIPCLGAYALMGGFTAAGYAYAFLADFRTLLLVIPAQALWFLMPRWFSEDFRAGFTPSLHGAILVAMIVLAYVLFVVFFKNEGVRTIRMQTELSLAKKIHDTLIPPLQGCLGRLEVFGRSLPGAEMGGDLIDLVQQNGVVDLMIADVSGHGIKAGVIMAVVKSAYRTRLRIGCELDSLMTDLNAVVGELVEPGMFVTAEALRFDPAGSFQFCGAGHGPMLHYHGASQTIEEVVSHAVPLGVLEDERFEVRTLDSGPGDVLMLMTDGLTEVFSKEGAMLGQEPIAGVFAQCANQPLSRIYEEVMRLVQTHGPQSDDQTLLLLRVR